MINRVMWFLLALTAALLLFWFVSLIRIEFLTSKHGAEFMIPDDVAWFVGVLDNVKVIEYTDRSARIYYYTRRSIAVEIHFVRSRNGNEWLFESWSTVWSYTGSAGSYVWPYYHHSIEGRIILGIFGIPYALLLSVICAISFEKRLKQQCHSEWVVIHMIKWVLFALIIVFVLFLVLIWVMSLLI